ncbi:class I SAM-dependent methyltransferase [Neptuniibacter halophilus]|uniref:class I SAM-dependent methyltransferase n=1 Tax=Neptuniibacter halophilus TaxID=651666 RepID=UPI002574731C|nr:class I SAM-dependent methyltransferase [Neptuniibacter halophilus]
MKRDTSLNQYFMPVWAAEQIIKHYYSHLTEKDTVLDIGTGDGRFLNAIPQHVNAVGIEIDPELAQIARENTGREVILGNAASTPFPVKPTLVIGNPPFEMKVVNSVIDQAYEHLDYGQEVGFVLPVYVFQTADTVMKYAEHWTLMHDLMPRNMFEGMQKPLMFARFVKERQTLMLGMFLYEETSDLLSLKKKYRMLFIGNQSSTHLWGEAVEQALVSLGGEGSLADIYQEIEGKRPTTTQHWKAQIRKVAQESFYKVARGIYSLPPRVDIAA